jgi:hypothetical protein
MTQAVSARELLIEVELAVLAGRNLAQIEAEILAPSGLDEESQSTVWLYAWGYRERASRKESFPPPPPGWMKAKYAHGDR